jgi:hypothetical protein
MRVHTPRKRLDSTLPRLLTLASCLLTLSVAAAGQTPAGSPSPTPAESHEEGPGGSAYPPMEAANPVKAGNYSIVSSIELGARGVSVDGNDDKYRSDVNYRAGFRLFESSFLVRADEGKGVLFDTLVVNSTGWGSDPYGYARGRRGTRGRRQPQLPPGLSLVSQRL